MAKGLYIILSILITLPAWAQSNAVTFNVKKPGERMTGLHGPEEQLCLVSLLGYELELVTCSSSKNDVSADALQSINQVVVPKGCHLANLEIAYYDYYRSHDEASLYMADGDGELSPQFYHKLHNAQPGDYIEFENILIEQENGERFKVNDFSFTVTRN